MNNTMVRGIRRAKIHPKSSFKNWGAQNTRGGNYVNEYGICYSPLKEGTFMRLPACVCREISTAL